MFPSGSGIEFGIPCHHCLPGTAQTVVKQFPQKSLSESKHHAHHAREKLYHFNCNLFAGWMALFLPGFGHIAEVSILFLLH